MLSKYLRAPAALAAASLSTLARSDYHVDILPPVTPVSHDIYSLHWGILWVCVVIFFIVFGAMFWSIFKHRRSQGAAQWGSVIDTLRFALDPYLARATKPAAKAARSVLAGIMGLSKPQQRSMEERSRRTAP